MTLNTEAPPLLGSDLPRIGTDVDPAPLTELRGDAKALGIKLMPWQEYALGMAEARNPDGSFLFREVASVVARQNGKSTKLAPLIRYRLRHGRRILHAAQDRIIPVRIFKRVADSFAKGEARVRLANGQEEVTLPNGGSYKIVASQRSGVRGNDADDLIVDELREQRDMDFLFAARPTITASANPQILYESNAGSADSVALNDLKARADSDPGLAYLEWSAAPELDAGDRAGWVQANPGLGRVVPLDLLDSFYRSALLSGNLAGWETEHLCRWVLSMYPRLVTELDWLQARQTLSAPLNPTMGISIDPGGRRASASLSWAQGAGSIGLMVLADVKGEPLDVDAFALDLRESALNAGVTAVGFDPLTDQHLARYFPNAQPVNGQTFANATERFVRDVETGKLAWSWADALSEDLPHAARKTMGGTAFVVERAVPNRPITSVLAAIRSHWLATEPDTGPPSVY